MRPLRISARNVVCYQSLDLDVADIRNAVIVGENGAGKSLLVDLIKIGLFDVGRLGPRALASMIGRWGDTAVVEVDFEHGGRLYRSTRTRRRTAKTSSRTDVVQTFDGSKWAPIDMTVEAILGASAATLGATTFLRYRGVDGLGDFGAAAATERKGMLYELRRTDRYEGFATAARKKVTESGALAASYGATAARLRQEADRERAVAARLEALRANGAALRVEIERLDGEIARAQVQAAARADLESALNRAGGALTDAETALRVHRNRSDELGRKIEAHKRTLADADTVRAAVARRHELADKWRVAAEVRSTAQASAASARSALATAAAELTAAQSKNATAKRIAFLRDDAADVAEELAVLGPVAPAATAAREAVAARDAADRQNAAADRFEKLTAELEEIDRDIAILEPLVGATREALDVRAVVEADTSRASGLATVPCGGGGEYAACRYLVEAGAARDRLEPGRARLTAALDALRASAGERADVAEAIRTGQWMPLQHALALLRSKAAGVRGQLASHAHVARVDVEPLAAEVVRTADHARAVEDAAAEFYRRRSRVVGGLDRALVDAQRRQHGIAGELRALGDVQAVDVAPLEIARASAAAEVEAAEKRVEAASAAVAEVEKSGHGLKELAERAPAVEAAAGALAAEQDALRALGDGAELVARVAAAQAEAERARAALAAAGHVDVRALSEIASVRRTELAAIDGQIAAALTAAQTAAARDLEADVAEQNERKKLRERALNVVLTKFYGEAPSMIIENDRASIERAANDWLRKTSALQIELVLQRPQKTDAAKVHETLEVDVLRPSGRAVRETCSAGELFRVDIGLAVGIGQALGAGRSWLCVDEGFGSLKGEVIASVTRGLHEMLEELDGLWVVEHNPLVINVFPTRIVVRTGPDGSFVEVQ